MTFSILNRLMLSGENLIMCSVWGYSITPGIPTKGLKISSDCSNQTDTWESDCITLMAESPLKSENSLQKRFLRIITPLKTGLSACRLEISKTKNEHEAGGAISIFILTKQPILLEKF